MTRRNRNQRDPQSWCVVGDHETVRQFSLHRMIETLSNNQLEALQTVADMHELEVKLQVMQAMLGNSAGPSQIWQWLNQLTGMDRSVVQQLLNGEQTQAQSATPPVKPPRSG